jgi:hypothetical protein
MKHLSFSLVAIFLMASNSFAQVVTDPREVKTIQLTEKQLEIVKGLVVPVGIYLTTRPQNELPDEYSKFSSPLNQKGVAMAALNEFMGESEIKEINNNTVEVLLINTNGDTNKFIVALLSLPTTVADLPYWLISNDAGKTFTVMNDPIGIISYCNDDDKKFILKIFPDLLN